MGANIDEQLVFASNNGNLKFVKTLINDGADVNAFCNLPLKRSSKNGHLEVVKYLIQNWAVIDEEAIQSASRKGHVEIVNLLKLSLDD